MISRGSIAGLGGLDSMAHKLNTKWKIIPPKGKKPSYEAVLRYEFKSIRDATKFMLFKVVPKK